MLREEVEHLQSSSA
jgi:hypothetical protein